MGQAKNRGDAKQREADARARIQALKPEFIVCSECSTELREMRTLDIRNKPGIEALFEAECPQCGKISLSVKGSEEAIARLALGIQQQGGSNIEFGIPSSKASAQMVDPSDDDEAVTPRDEPRADTVLHVLAQVCRMYLDQYEKSGPTVVQTPTLYAIMPSGAVGVLPLEGMYKNVTEFTILICHRVLKSLGAQGYVFACDTRTTGPRPRYSFHCCGGIPGWDVSTAVLLDFAGKKVTSLQRYPNKSSLQERAAHYSAVPNLMNPIDISSWEESDLAAVNDMAQIYINGTREGFPPEHLVQ